MKVRKKPVVVDAHQWLGPHTWETAPFWMLEARLNGVISLNDDCSITIVTLEGNHRGDLNDWVIRGVKGEIYPCKPDIFNMTYELV